MRQSLALCVALLATAGAATKAQDRAGVNSPVQTTRGPVSGGGDGRARLPPPPADARPEKSGDAPGASAKPGGQDSPFNPVAPPDAATRTTPPDRHALAAPPPAAEAEDAPGAAADAPALGNKFQWSRTDSYFVKIASRMVLNPTRSVADLLRFKKPWHRDAGLR